MKLLQIVGLSALASVLAYSAPCWTSVNLCGSRPTCSAATMEFHATGECYHEYCDDAATCHTLSCLNKQPTAYPKRMMSTLREVWLTTQNGVATECVGPQINTPMIWCCNCSAPGAFCLL